MKVSSKLRNLMLDRLLLTDVAGFVFKVYSGAIPAHPEDSIGSSVLLATITAEGGAGLTWEAAADAVASKNSEETWSGAGVAALNASYIRFCAAADTGAADPAAKRIQLVVGTNPLETPKPDVIFTSREVTIGDLKVVSYAQIFLPEEL